MTTARGDALYDRLEATVIRLLADYGGTVIIDRYATAFDPVTQTAVRTVTGSNAVNGVFTTMTKMPNGGRAMVNYGGRIADDERIVVMDSSALPKLKDRLRLPSGYTATIGGAAPGAIVESDYPASWTVEEVATINPSGTQPLAYFVKVKK